jgi:hypothetical protein
MLQKCNVKGIGYGTAKINIYIILSIDRMMINEKLARNKPVVLLQQYASLCCTKTLQAGFTRNQAMI